MKKQDSDKFQELVQLVYLESYMYEKEILKLLAENDYSDEVVMFLNDRFILPPEIIEFIAKEKGIRVFDLIGKLIR